MNVWRILRGEIALFMFVLCEECIIVDEGLIVK